MKADVLKKLRKVVNVTSLNIQLALWIVGINVHNPVTDECTPDFSCCTEIRTPFIKRVKSIKKHFLMINFHKFINN